MSEEVPETGKIDEREQESGASDAEETEETKVEQVKADEPGPVDEDSIMDESEEDKQRRACRQIEFYFSDSNLPYDRFMWTLHTANDDHWVPIATVASFKRMREFKSLGMDWVTNALKTSEELEIDESNANVRRRTEVTEPKNQFERSIYAKGFGKEEPGLQQRMERFFNKYGWTNAVRMRRTYDTQEFKGSVFVEFSDLSSVERFLKADPKPSWNGEELQIMTKEEYCEMKIKEKGLSGKQATIRRERERRSGTGKAFNAFAEMKEKTSPAQSDETAKQEVYLEFMGKKLKVHNKDGGSVVESEIPYVKGSALKFCGKIGNFIKYDEIKGPLAKRFNRPPFIKWDKGSDRGLVGFDKALSEEDIAFIKENLKTINEVTVEWTPAEEEEEKQFLIERAQNAARKALKQPTRGNGRGGRGGSRGGRGGDRGGGRGRGRGRGRGGSGGHDGDRRDRKSGDSKSEVKGAESTDSKKADDAAQAGEKRKRAVEPDGGPDVGVRGVGVPVISSKKSKTEESEAS